MIMIRLRWPEGAVIAIFSLFLFQNIVGIDTGVVWPKQEEGPVRERVEIIHTAEQLGSNTY